MANEQNLKKWKKGQSGNPSGRNNTKSIFLRKIEKFSEEEIEWMLYLICEMTLSKTSLEEMRSRFEIGEQELRREFKIKKRHFEKFGNKELGHISWLMFLGKRRLSDKNKNHVK